MENKRELVKNIITTAVSLSVTFTVYRLIKTHTPVTKRYQKAQVVIAAYSISESVADLVVERAEKQYDKVCEKIDEIRKKNNI